MKKLLTFLAVLCVIIPLSAQDPTYTFTNVWNPTTGSGTSTANYFRGVAIDKTTGNAWSGRVYATDTKSGAARIWYWEKSSWDTASKYIEPSGSFATTPPAGGTWAGSSPYGITVDKGGVVFAHEFGTKKTHGFPQDGTSAFTIKNTEGADLVITYQCRYIHSQGSFAAGDLKFYLARSGGTNGEVFRISQSGVPGENKFTEEILLNELNDGDVNYACLGSVSGDTVYISSNGTGEGKKGLVKYVKTGSTWAPAANWPNINLTIHDINFTGNDEYGIMVAVPGSRTFRIYRTWDGALIGETNFGKTAEALAVGGVDSYDGKTFFASGSTGSISYLEKITSNKDVKIPEPIITLKDAREDLNGDFQPDRLSDTLTVTGVIFTPNYLTNSSDLSYYMWDGTAGINLYINYPSGATPKALSIGDSVKVTGKIAYFRGLTELDAMKEDNITVLKSGAALPVPVELTLAQFEADPEKYESSLILVKNLSKLSGNWPAAGADANLPISDGNDTIIYRVDRDTDVDGTIEPVWPRDLIGVITQYTSTSSKHNDGYQIQPRSVNDILAPVPVELLSFSSKVSGNAVSLSWQTATETNNMGFEVYRNNEMLKFVPGFGTTAERKSYSFEDKSVSAGKHSYKLIQVDYSGIKETVGNIEVDVNAAPAGFTLNQNYPNPFNPSTVIAFSLPVDAKVNLRILNVLGEEVATLVNSNMASGQHHVTFNASDFNSGIYFYSIEVNGIDGNNFASTKKMLLIK